MHHTAACTRVLPADPRLVPGGGAVEMAVSHGLAERANSGAVEGVEQVAAVCWRQADSGKPWEAGWAGREQGADQRGA